MAASKAKTHKLLKRSLITIGVLVAIVLALHLWFVHNARIVLKHYIEASRKFKLELSDLELSLLSNKLQIKNADLVSVDSATAPITYRVSFSKISLKVGSLWVLIIQKKLLLDSVQLQNPDIQVMQWRKDTSQAIVKDELSIPQEMGKLYTSLLNALDEFGVRRVIIDNAKISLINKMRPAAEPVSVSNIFFDLSRTPLHFRKGKKNIYSKEGQSVMLRTTNQNIALPGGRHRLAFKSFQLHLFGETIQLDSCTVTANATDSLKSNYKIFFKKLMLTGVDFAAMSILNVIKADSVYCENPMFDFNLYRNDAVKKKAGIPDANQMVRELTGNLNLAYVGVKNAGLHFDIYGKTKQSFFNSNKDNFEMHCLRINPALDEPVSIRRFDMTLRDYHLYNEDSSSVYSFDSLHFLNSKIALNNFAVHSTSGNHKLRNKVDITVPLFELSDLNWSELIFNQNMVASEAILDRPTINFTQRKASRSSKKINLFDALQNIDSLVSLGVVTVMNGQVNMQLSATTSFTLQDMNFKILSNKFLGSVNKEGLRSAVDRLSFTKGILRLKDITAQLQNARFTGKNLLFADKVDVSAINNKMIATVNKVNIDNMQLDDNAETIEVDGLAWQSADIALKSLPSSGNNSKDKITIALNNIAGKQTRLQFTSSPLHVSTIVENLRASSLLKQGNQLQVEGLLVDGRELAVNSNDLSIRADGYQVNGNETSLLTGVSVQQIHGRDSLYISSPQIQFATNINDVFANVLHLSHVQATSPVITFSKWDTTRALRDTFRQSMPLTIDDFTATQPAISISTHRNDSVTRIHIPVSENGFMHASGIHVSHGNLQLDSASLSTTTATFLKPSGKTIGVSNGKVDLSLSNIQLTKKEGQMSWAGFINSLSLKNAEGLQMENKKNSLQFKDASIGNLNLSSELLPNFSELLRANLTAWLRIPQGQFVDSNTTIQWYNANYTHANKTLSLDSFIYHPTLSRDSALAHAPYQFDYITAKTGAVSISDLDIEQYEKDSSFIANTVIISNPVITVYRDKQLPQSPSKKEKLFPAAMIKSVKLPLVVDSIVLKDGLTTYGEKNAKSGKEGTLSLTKVNATIGHVSNTNLSATDSLSLHLQTSLMDAANLDLHLQQSYVDSLQGFSITASIKQTDLGVFNPVFVPLSNIQVTSGQLDSLSFYADAKSDLAFGEIKMHYRGLRILLVKNGVAGESSFIGRVVSTLANNLLLRRNNSTRTGIIYTARTPGQSFINYVVKTALSGVLSSVGVKKNRKY